MLRPTYVGTNGAIAMTEPERPSGWFTEWPNEFTDVLDFQLNDGRRLTTR